ncbi:MAG: VanZ family protein [Planctomycetota bacterium]|nr:VanZ family protein [Planctomycetota bacterium]
MIPSLAILQRRKHLALSICVILWVFAFIVSHVPADRLPKTHVGDKYLHFVGFFGLAIALLLTLAGYNVPRLRRVVVAICITAGYAAFDEATQALVNRHAAFSDWLADVCGALLAVIVLEVCFSLLGKLRRGSAPNI